MRKKFNYSSGGRLILCLLSLPQCWFCKRISIIARSAECNSAPTPCPPPPYTASLTQIGMCRAPEAQTLSQLMFPS
ncbi:hypothetical protein RRG08_038599 [Elysia crispata]|uniref:Secreted protein n=1 Tax=Elysia crispata TaxID=231223 RepID=A0AAE1E3J4_9GAST|nr:hypothetical protein RRG08_038599 [Elysia crispata]